MSDAKMIARAWLDESYRASLLAQGIVVPPPPNDLSDEQLDTSVHACADHLPAPVGCLTAGTVATIACSMVG